MKKVLLISVTVFVVLLACVKSADINNTNNNCTPVSPSAEQAQILAFINTDSVSFMQDTSGVYYHITAPGTGLAATYSSNIFFTFKSTLLDGTAIGSDSTSPVEVAIATAISGFQDMAGYFKKGTKIKLIIPSSLAYGCQGLTNGTLKIPANSVIYYDLAITGIQ
jgi:FKBP-type peptidyl-prolyl cis-trans isomerase